MLPLLNAIYSRFTSTPSLSTAFPGGLFRERAPEGTAMPYLVSHIVNSKTDLAYNGVYRTETQIRFAAYGLGHDAIGTALAVWMTALETQPLTLSAGVNDTLARLTEPTPTLHRHDAAGNDVWAWSVTYVFGAVGG